jgi:hypothetical protein
LIALIRLLIPLFPSFRFPVRLHCAIDFSQSIQSALRSHKIVFIAAHAAIQLALPQRFKSATAWGIHSDLPRSVPRHLSRHRLRQKHSGFTLIALMATPAATELALPRRFKSVAAWCIHSDLLRSTPRLLPTRRLRKNHAPFALIALIAAPAAMQLALPQRFKGATAWCVHSDSLRAISPVPAFLSNAAWRSGALNPFRPSRRVPKPAHEDLTPPQHGLHPFCVPCALLRPFVFPIRLCLL